MTTAERLRDYGLCKGEMSGQELVQAADELEALTKERDQLREALQKILSYPVHSEPVGGAMAMQDIAQAALKGEMK